VGRLWLFTGDYFFFFGPSINPIEFSWLKASLSLLPPAYPYPGGAGEYYITTVRGPFSSSPSELAAVGINSPSGHPNFLAVGPLDEAAFGVTFFNSIPAHATSP